MDGLRETWIRQRVCHALSVDDDIFDDALGVGGLAAVQHVANFLDGKDSVSALVFYRTRVESTKGELSINERPARSGNGNKAPVSALTGSGAVDEDAPAPTSGAPLFVGADVLPDNVGDHDIMYFIRNMSKPVACPDEAAVDQEMAVAISFGVIRGQEIETLERILAHVYVPLLNARSSTPDAHTFHVEQHQSASNSSNERKPSGTRIVAGFQDELISSVNKFASHLGHLALQVRGQVELRLPEIAIEDPEAAIDSDIVVKEVDAILDEWAPAVAKVLEQASAQARPPGAGPLAEIEFWRARYTLLSTIHEQLQRPQARKMIDVLELLDSQQFSAFKYQLGELTKLHAEAKDNVKFLTTLERHFKVLSQGPLSLIAETLPSMMNAIRMVWVISRHFNTDERMNPLLERIANEISNQISSHIDVQSIFRTDREVARRVVREAIAVAEKWSETYFEVRERIEQSGRDARWEFDKKRLFDRTNYMATQCGHISEVLGVLDDFHNILGADLKAVTGDAQGIEEVLRRVDTLVVPLETIPFDVFDRRFQASWEAFMNKFRDETRQIEAITREFINISFKKLRSASGAFDLLLKFRRIRSRESINRQMQDKFSDILTQFAKEVDQAQQIFHQSHSSPPTDRTHPSVAGAISWARGLFARVKNTMLRFHAHEEILRSDQGSTVKAQYVAFGRTVRDYCNHRFRTWCSHVEDTTMGYLKWPLLCAASDGEERAACATLQSPSDLLKYSGRLAVNFAPALRELIVETKHLDSLGFSSGIPEIAVNVTLQEDKFLSLTQQCQVMLDEYHAEVERIAPEERGMLLHRLRKLREALAPGIYPLNWNSLGIADYVEESRARIGYFRSILHQIHKNATAVQTVVDAIRSAELVPAARTLDVGAPVPDLQDALEFDESDAQTTVEALQRRYASTRLLLGKIEELVLGSNTGSASVMASYYKYWEKAIYDALCTAIGSAMQRLLERVFSGVDFRSGVSVTDAPTEDSRVNTYVSHPSAPATERATPRFRVYANLSYPYISVVPARADIQRFVQKALHRLLAVARNFTRWMDGTCIQIDSSHLFRKGSFAEAQGGQENQRAQSGARGAPLGDAQSTPDDRALTNAAMQVSAASSVHGPVFTLFDEVSQSEHVLRHFLTANQAAHSLFADVRRYLEPWKRYFVLFTKDRVVVAEKLQAQHLTCGEYDRYLSYYRRIGESVSQQPPEDDVCGVRVNVVELASALRRAADDWIASIGAVLLGASRTALKALTDRLARIETQLTHSTDSLDDLKTVLQCIHETRDTTMQTELEYEDIEERFHTLTHYGVEVPINALETAQGLRVRWAAICAKAKARDTSLRRVKRRFTKVTQQDIAAFRSESSAFAERFADQGPATASSMEDSLELLRKFTKEMEEIRTTRERLTEAERLFGLAPSAFPDIVAAERALSVQTEILGHYAEFRAWRANVAKALFFAELDLESLQQGAHRFTRTLEQMGEAMKATRNYERFVDEVDGFRGALPLLRDLKHDALRPRHWQELMQVTGIEINLDPKALTLASVLDMGLASHADTIATIVAGASKELSIEEGLRSIALRAEAMRFELHRYTKNGEERAWILRSVDEIVAEIDDSAMQLQSMSASRFVAPFASDVQGWERKLSRVAEVVDVWMLVQRKWMYLESIFVGSEDIRLQLPEEAKRFDSIDRSFVKLMSDVHRAPGVIVASLVEGRLESLQTLTSELDRCQKSLSDYLDAKRVAFPRFFFISDDELLSILGSSEPSAVQDHMLKLFDNCATLEFGDDATVTGMVSSEGERFALRSPVAAEGAVESWMLSVEEAMRETLHAATKSAVYSYAHTPRVPWVSDSLGMTSIAGSQVWWTWEVEDVFDRVRGGDKHAMKDLARKLTGQLNELVATVRGDLDKLSRRKICTLIIIDVHARDIIDGFVRDSILDEREFAWESQLRFYWLRDDDDMRVRQCTGEFGYGYEYMGLNGRLVITPLTDRCYMTLTQALSFRLGGAPAGPAGTGKTETVKDLAKSLALQCVVFNCGEGLDFKAMGTIFSGLVQTGAWGCFDEFNRINAEVLSVVSAQIKSIQTALAADCDTFMFEGRETALRPSVGLFITMNPGYAGRTELPDNLQALFRPVTMVVPDLEQICAIMLFSEGFESAAALAKKMTVLYRLAKEQLSKQYHYDFGLRALKSVLVMAGSLKRASPTLDEETVLMRALRDMNAPKFVFEDVPLFSGLIQDLFPGIDCPRVLYPELADAIRASLQEESNEILDSQVDKVVQVHETMLTRHSTMVVGPTGGGKSLVIHTLAKAQTHLGTATKLLVLNPKALPVVELYGELDPTTREWTDGLLSHMFREACLPLPRGRREVRYITFDGDVDAVWIENMNSVMDDNKLLTLPNGERIRLPDHVKLLFEVDDLQHASPATVSRCGMVYVDPKNLGFAPYVSRWCQGRGPGQAEEWKRLFAKYAESCTAYVLEGALPSGEFESPLDLMVPQTALNMVAQLCHLIDAVLPQGTGNATAPATAAPSAGADSSLFEAIFIHCLIWSVGACLTGASRGRFDTFVKQLSGLAIVDRPDVEPRVGSLPGSDTLYEWYFDAGQIDSKSVSVISEGAGTSKEGERASATPLWRQWRTKVPAYAPPADGRASSILVPTVDTVRNATVLARARFLGRPALFVGESGTAKTVTIQRFLDELTPETSMVQNMYFSNRTTSRTVQVALEDRIEKRTKDTFGPPVGKQLTVFVDDLNMPVVDRYGTQQPIAFLKLLIERGGMYDRGKDLHWKNVKDTTFLASMAPPGGGRAAVDPRFVSLFLSFGVTFPDHHALKNIFTTMLESHFAVFSSEIRECVHPIVDATLKFHESIVRRLPPTPSKFHYVFNLRDLRRVCEGLMCADHSVFQTLQSVVRFWAHEMLRVFYDRLVSSEDQDLVTEELGRLAREYFASQADEALCEPILFSDVRAFCEESTGEPRLVEDVGSFESAKRLFERVLTRFNETNKAIDMVLFEDAVAHVVRILRILRMPRGNALLVGVGGSGKRSLTRLAAFAAECEVFEITLTRGYGDVEFREDLKSLYTKLGAENRRVAFLFTDQQIVHEGFLELINNMLTAGMVPALYSEEEKDPLIHAVRDDAVRDGATDTREQCWSYFVERCRDNLHVVLAMSPTGDALRKRARDFPGIVACCVIDWFTAWPREALHSVATRFLAREDLPDEHRDAVVDFVVEAHQDVLSRSATFEAEMRRRNHVTPKNFLDLIQTYRNLLAAKRRENTDRVSRLEGGLGKLVQAAGQVDEMRARLGEQKRVVEQKTTECSDLLEEITDKSRTASEKQTQAQEKEVELTAQNEKIAEQRELANRKLDAALPALERAQEALNVLDKKDITEIRSFQNPNELVAAVCECVVIITDFSRDVNWKTAKQMMSGTSFLNSLLQFDKDKLRARQITQVERYFKKYPEFSEPEQIKDKSLAAEGLLKWVDAMVKYYYIARDVNPLREAVAKAEKDAARGARELARTKRELNDLNELTQKLRADLDEATAEKERLRQRAEEMEHNLDTAARLLAGLESERARWSEDMDALRRDRERLVGNCLVAAAFLSYAGAFNHSYRQSMLQDTWLSFVSSRGIPATESFSLTAMLTSEVEISQWASESLPTDELSIQNGILTTRSERFPLLIDPQMQAINWIRQREGNLLDGRIKSFSDDFLKHLEMAIRYGHPFVFENVDDYIDPVVEPVLERQIISDGARKFIRLGDKEVDWDDNFRLFMVTRVSNPVYSPEVFGKTIVINCSVTEDGLEEQCLNLVAGHERPDLQSQREGLVREISQNNALLIQLEDELLQLLANATGNLLENTKLISTLEETKTKAVEIGEKLDVARSTAAEIDAVRDEYRPAAKRGSLLFFAMSSLSELSRMYEYSLSSFLQLFKQSLDAAPHSAAVAQRVQNIIQTLTTSAYRYTCTGLFEEHKLLFSFEMVLKIMEGEGKLSKPELEFFLKGNTALDAPARSSPAAWIPEAAWRDACALESVGSAALARLPDLLATSSAAWQAWYDEESPESIALPDALDESLNSFQRLLVMRSLRPDRVVYAVAKFVSEALGPEFVQPPTINYPAILAQTTALTPVVFVLSPGADPSYDVFKLAEEQGMGGSRLKNVALGQGQGPLAAQYLESGAARGQWVILQNCHLMPSWLQTLEKKLAKITNPDPKFRLWLTTEPTAAFPLGILQRSLKVVTEPPNGLMLNMRATYSKIGDRDVGGLPGLAENPLPHAFRPLVYVLSFFHAVVQERRRYGKIGWNVPYAFNESDFRVSMSLLDTYLKKSHARASDTLPWGSLRYLIGEAMYGGRVTDSFDRRVLITYLEEYIGDFLFDQFQRFSFFSKDSSALADGGGAAESPFILPADGPVSVYKGAVERIPLTSSPEVLGLHANAEISYLGNAARSLWAGLLSLQPRTGAGSGDESREARAEALAADLLSQIPVPTDVLKLQKSLGVPTPTQVVLLQELDHFNRLLEMMRSSLEDLRRALAGEIGMSAELDELAASLYNADLPPVWQRRAPQTRMKLGSWFAHLQRRSRQYQSWTELALAGQELKTVWLSGLHVPETYVAALVQTVCRAKRWALDRSALLTRVTSMQTADDVTERPAYGAYIEGLLLEGAGWDAERGMLRRQRPKELSVPLPILELIPVEAGKLKTHQTLRTPVYVTSDRRDAMGKGLVFEADLATNEHPSHWILQGVALVLNGDA